MGSWESKHRFWQNPGLQELERFVELCSVYWQLLESFPTPRAGQAFMEKLLLSVMNGKAWCRRPQVIALLPLGIARLHRH